HPRTHQRDARDFWTKISPKHPGIPTTLLNHNRYYDLTEISRLFDLAEELQTQVCTMDKGIWVPRQPDNAPRHRVHPAFAGAEHEWKTMKKLDAVSPWGPGPEELTR